MGAYLLKRLLLIIPTLFGIVLVTFALAQFMPGGPVEQIMAKMQGADSSIGGRIGGGGDGIGQGAAAGGYRGSQGLDQAVIDDLKRQFGLDKPVLERFWILLKSYATFDLGKSYFRGESVAKLILERLPVSISLGLWMTLLTYLVSIPLGIRKAVKDGAPVDVWTSLVLAFTYAIPGFVWGILLLVVFAGGSFFQWFPSRGLLSEAFSDFGFMRCATSFACVKDYFWHLALPLMALAMGTFTTLTMLTKNSFLDELNKQYVLTARSKGLTEGKVLYGHVFRNAMMLVIAGFPHAFILAFFSGSLLIEALFTLPGLGLLTFESIDKRDFPVILGALFVFSLIGLVVNLISDFIYTLVDPRIDFETREV